MISSISPQARQNTSFGSVIIKSKGMSAGELDVIKAKYKEIDEFARGKADLVISKATDEFGKLDVTPFPENSTGFGRFCTALVSKYKEAKQTTNVAPGANFGEELIRAAFTAAGTLYDMTTLSRMKKEVGSLAKAEQPIPDDFWSPAKSFGFGASTGGNYTNAFKKLETKPERIKHDPNWMNKIPG